MAMEELARFNPNYNMNFNTLNSALPAGGDWMQSLIKYLPAMTGGFSALGGIFQLVQLIQRIKQMSDLQKFYKNWQQAGNQDLSQNLGNLASRGLAGSPKSISDVVAGSYAPYQEAAGRGWASTIPGMPQAFANPFDAFLKGIEGARSAFPSTPKETGINFNYNATRNPLGMVDVRGLNMNPSGNPIFDIPSTDIGG